MALYDEYAMRAKIDECLKTVAVVLDNNKAATIAAADRVFHQYEDKYLLANNLTNMSIACIVNALELIGVSHAELGTMKAWNVHRAVSLKYERRLKCRFVKEIEREVEDPTRVQVESGIFRTTVKTITKVKEYIYQIELEYTLLAHSGVGDNPAEVIRIASSSSQLETALRNNAAPFPESTVDTFNVNISWLLKHLDQAASTAMFSIDRAHASCATPRQNADVVAALQFQKSFFTFCGSVYTNLRILYDVQSLYGEATAAKFDFSVINANGIFNPVVPLFTTETNVTAVVSAEVSGEGGEQTLVTTDHSQHSTALPQPVVNQLVQEQRRSLAAKCTQVANLFPALASGASTSTVRNGLFGSSEATLMVVLLHLSQFSQYYEQGVDFIEHMIRQQLVAAVGKELTARDFAQYMTFHNRKVFKEAYQPQPFSYAVRRSPVHSPEGQIQIETAAVSPAEPIYTVAQHTENAPHMEFALNATTTVKFGGERHLHGWMAHRFSGQALPELKFIAEARQFSSYIVLIGRIASAKLFQPKYGFIVQNKDEFRIPLDLEQIPTAKEFKDAISSLSPEQQRFAKAFRSMQLESTLFGVCVIQIKPQLEKVLKLQADSLTKEIKLTQDLMQLFIKYQIPSDLLSFDDSVPGGVNVPAAERLLKVKRHVQAMQEMLATAKDEEVAAANQLREFERGPPPAPVKFDGFTYREEECDSLELCAAPPPAFAKSASTMKKGGGPSFSFSMMRRSSAPSVPPPPPAAAPMKNMEERKERSVSVRSNASVAPPGASAIKPALSSAPAAAPTQAQSATSTVKEPTKAPEYSTQVETTAQGEQVDYTQYPNKLEEMYTRYDPDSSLRPTIINPGASWTKRFQAGLLSAPQTNTLNDEQQATEKSAAFDLLDALTRSGALPMEHASLHVIIAATHCFDRSLMDTVVQKNVNPIERVERSTLIMAAALNDVPAAELITEGQLDRVSTFSPMLFDNVAQEALE